MSVSEGRHDGYLGAPTAVVLRLYGVDLNLTLPHENTGLEVPGVWTWRGHLDDRTPYLILFAEDIDMSSALDGLALSAPADYHGTTSLAMQLETEASALRREYTPTWPVESFFGRWFPTADLCIDC